MSFFCLTYFSLSALNFVISSSSPFNSPFSSSSSSSLIAVLSFSFFGLSSFMSFFDSLCISSNFLRFAIRSSSSLSNSSLTSSFFLFFCFSTSFSSFSHCPLVCHVPRLSLDLSSLVPRHCPLRCLLPPLPVLRISGLLLLLLLLDSCLSGLHL